MKSVFLKSLSVILSVILIFTQMQYVSAKPIELKTFQINEKDLFPNQLLLDQAFCQLDALDNLLNENNEITANLDTESAKAIIQLLKELNKKIGVTIIFASHDQRILDIIDRKIKLQDGMLETIKQQ